MIEINNKKLCESCFCETDKEICPYCGFSAAGYSADPLVLPIGTKLGDKIIIGRVMGKGGFGVTYLGYDTRMDKTIAVKEYYPNGIAYRAPSGTEVAVADTRSSETFENGAQKFYTEAEMVAQFNGNPNIVSVYDYFKANNTVYLVMEYLRGLTLKNYVKKHGRLTDGQALYVIDKIAAALSITHSAGVLHRDISPDNIMLCMDGKVKLIDFGAARQIVAESSSNLTVVMKPGYTPIEQYTKKGKQGAWTDIYSLGVSIYYALTGVIIDDPYARIDSDSELAENKHGINDDLWAILKKCTMINASERYGSAIDLRKALRSVSAPIESEPISLSEDDLKTDNDSETPVTTASEGESPVTTGVPAGDTVDEIEVFEDKTEEPAPLSSAEPAVKSASDKKKGKKKFIIAGICAAVVIAIGVVVGIVLGTKRSNESNTSSDNSAAQTSSTVSETEESKPESTVNSVTEIPEQSVSISKSQLNGFDGDIRVTLGVRQKNREKDPDGNFYHCIRILADNEKDIDVNATSLKKDNYNFFPADGGYNMDFVFVIPHEVAEQINDKVYFELCNVVIDSLSLEEDKYDKVIDFDDKYPGDWQLDGFIPKSELESFNSDVRIRYDLDVKLLGSADDLYYHIMPKTAFYDPVSVKAYNLVLFNEDEIYEFFQEGENQIVFEISKEEIAKLPDEGLAVQVHNVLPRSASLRGLSENSTEPLYIPLNAEYPGSWKLEENKGISKDDLEKFSGDVKIVLDIERVDKEGEEHGHCLTITDGRGAQIDPYVLNTGKDIYNNYPMENADKTKFTFILRKDEMSAIYKELKIYGDNAYVKSATVFDYDLDEFKPSPDAKVMNFTSDFDKVNQDNVLMEPYCPNISKKELESFGSDVKVTLTLEQVNEYIPGVSSDSDYNDRISSPGYEFIHPWSGNHFVVIEAENGEHDGNHCYFLAVKNVPDTFTFVISKGEIGMLDDESGLNLRCKNVRITSAALEKA